jgi:hypothetical protein
MVAGATSRGVPGIEVALDLLWLVLDAVAVLVLVLKQAPAAVAHGKDCIAQRVFMDGAAALIVDAPEGVVCFVVLRAAALYSKRLKDSLNGPDVFCSFS